MAGPAGCSISATSTPLASASTPFVPPGALDGLDPERTGRDRLPTVPELFKVVDDSVPVAWTVSPFVTEGWRDSSSPSSRPRRLSRHSGCDVIHVCRLTSPIRSRPGRPASTRSGRWPPASTISIWTRLHFVGPDTDLTVGLLPSSRFAKAGGSSTTRRGIKHVPNLPTEELYTTPDPERTQGYVASTKPLDVGGAIVQGLRVRFDGGRAVEIDADENAEALRRRCATDDGAARLGEVALVDDRSRIGRLGRTFFNTLLDENAASHVALGDAYASPIADPADLPRINESAIHVDFMVGVGRRHRLGRDPRRRRAAASCRRGVADLTSA